LPPDIEPLALSREQLSRLGERELTLIRSFCAASTAQKLRTHKTKRC
jgi:hypothetical protein